MDNNNFKHLEIKNKKIIKKMKKFKIIKQK